MRGEGGGRVKRAGVSWEKSELDGGCYVGSLGAVMQ